MSHVTIKEANNAEHQIKDLTALKRAVARFPNAVFLEGKRTFKAYGDEGDKVKNVRHAIGLMKSNKSYEVGICESKMFPGTFNLAFDSFSRELEPVFGEGLEKLSMFYHAEALRSQAMRNHDVYREQIMADGTIIAEMDTTVRMGV